MGTSDKIVIGLLLLILGVGAYGIISNNNTPPPDPSFSNPFGLGPKEALLYSTYLADYVRPTGAAISNHIPVWWCNQPNDGIGCGEEVIAEAVGRSVYFSAATKDKPITDRYVNYYYDFEQHPTAHFMMWKLLNGVPTTESHKTSSVDGELEMVEGLSIAQAQWGSDDKGRSYALTARRILDGLKPGIVTDLHGVKTLPFCMEATSGTARPCKITDTTGAHTTKVNLGYLNLRTLKYACSVDSDWCPVYSGSKSLLIGAIKNGGAYNTYYPDTGTYTVDETAGFVQQNWVLERLILDGSSDSLAAAKPLYDQSRALFYANGKKICTRFDPSVGCVKSNSIPTDSLDELQKPALNIYADYARMAAALGDKTFASDLNALIQAKCAQDTYGDGPVLCNPDNYGNIIVLQADVDMRRAGVTVG